MKKLCVVVVAVVVVLVSSCGRDDSTEVDMVDHSFEPETLTVSAGDTVTWKNDSDEGHTVTAVQDSLPDGGDYFSSGGASSEEDANDSLTEDLIKPGGVFEWTFEEPGTYRYYCIPHKTDGMVGTIVVE